MWSGVDIGIFGRPYFGERVSGDWAFASQKNEWVFLAIVDGLGHGKEAHKIALLTKECLSEAWKPDVIQMLSKLHKKLQGTGGAAIGLALINMEKRIINYVGIGNTVMRRLGASPSKLLSIEGVVGVRMRTPKTQTISMEDSDILLLYTDGISENFSIEELPHIKRQRASLLAKTIVRNFGSQFDDSTCIVLKLKNEN